MFKLLLPIFYLCIIVVLLIVIILVISIFYRALTSEKNFKKVIKTYIKTLKKENFYLLSKEKVVANANKKLIGYILFYLNEEKICIKYLSEKDMFEKYIVSRFFNENCFLLQRNKTEDIYKGVPIYIYEELYINKNINSIVSEIVKEKEKTQDKEYIYVLDVLYNFFKDGSITDKNKELLSEAFEYGDEFVTDKNKLKFLNFYKESLYKYLNS